ncbi:hypothetical protein Nepgr_033633 [Nepenthes gracilis]|uniref:Uncharacterized protein n=1 Tax=Nepenthes gracilis TaxID=150966 RepID=A0AAD3TME8_NEPGR|nr:hypothetical protein Nepgr_033633 [Nepenthes gracilis]
MKNDALDLCYGDSLLSTLICFRYPVLMFSVAPICLGYKDVLLLDAERAPLILVGLLGLYGTLVVCLLPSVGVWPFLSAVLMLLLDMKWHCPVGADVLVAVACMCWNSAAGQMDYAVLIVHHPVVWCRFHICDGDAVMDYLLLDSTVADSCYMMYSLKFEAGVVPLGSIGSVPRFFAV